ncbi:MAG: TonB-dependent receptor [Microscillaceae bacterium]|nr:TonB-dependent receptor [Microscillaceae bacterium]
MKKNLFNVIIKMSLYMYYTIRLAIVPLLLGTSIAWATGQTLSTVKVNLNVSDMNLNEVLRELESKTDFNFLYLREKIPYNTKVSIKAKGSSLRQVLKSLAQQAHVDFQRVGGLIYVRKSKEIQQPVLKTATSVEESVSQNDREITGTVTSAKTGEPLAGATVLVKGTSIGVATDVYGKYTLSIPEDAETLIFSYTGFFTKEVKIGTQSIFDITLEEDVASLGEIVVVAYGIQKKSDVTGSISSTKSEDFNKGVFTNPTQLLQGKIPGINVSSASGEPGASQDVIIRGIGSLRSGTTPLYVLDGFVLDNSSASGLATNPLNFINPNDITSIEVLKDASASALYGARASNGVVVITTKKGQTGKAKFNLATSTAWSSIANKIDVFSADEFRIAVPANGGNLDDLGSDTDWQDELTQTGFSYDVNFSMSGGTPNTSYFASVGVQNQEGILINSKLRRYSGKLNVSQKAFNGRVTIDYNLTASRIENLRPDNSSIVVNMLQLNPTIPVYTDGEPTLLDNALNPIVRNDIFSDEAINNRILANIAPSVEIIKGLRYKINLGVDFTATTRDQQLIPYALLEGFENGSLSTGIFENTNYLVENTLSYEFNKGTHSFTFLAGHSYQEFYFHTRVFSMQGFADNGIDPRFQDQTSTNVTPTTLSTVAERNELQSFFGRINYSYKGKYLLTATMRADGSSKFGDNNKYGYFPSVALGWNIAEEDFFSVPWVNSLKLRASWGQTGNQEIPAKITQQSFIESKDNNDTYPLDPDANSLDEYPFGTIFTRLANDDIQWEVSTQTDFGLDFELFGSRLIGSFDYYHKVSDNILLEVVPPDPIQPTSTYWTNIPEMEIRNSGIEIGLEYKSNPTKEFKYSIGGNISTIKNEVVNSPFAVLTTGAAQGAGQTGATINGYINGEPVGSFYMLQFDGIGPDGLNQFVDTNGDDVILENDRTVVGAALPDLIYAFQLSFAYKNFDLGLNFNGLAGNKIYNHTKMSLFNKGNLAASSNTTDFATQFPEEDITNSNTVSTRYLEDGGYLRLNNATLAYTFFPGKFGLGNGVESIRLSLTGQNLFVISDYSGFDPEVNTGTSRGGIQTFGIDRFTYPAARTFLVGLNVTF